MERKFGFPVALIETLRLSRRRGSELHEQNGFARQAARRSGRPVPPDNVPARLAVKVDLAHQLAYGRQLALSLNDQAEFVGLHAPFWRIESEGAAMRLQNDQRQHCARRCGSSCT